MSRTNGLTLIELLIALVIAALLAATTFPSLLRWVDRHRLETGLDLLTRSLSLARSEAVKRAGHVSLSTPNARWEEGWQVFFDRNNNGLPETEDTIIYVQQPIPGLRIRGNTPLQRLVTYRADGRSVLPNGAFQAGSLYLCPTAQQLNPYRLVIARSGRARIEKLASGASECAE